MTPLRLCVLGRTMPAHRGGKGMFHPYLVASALAARGHDITILTTARTDGITESRPNPGLCIRYLAGAPADRYSDEFWAESAAAFDDLHAKTPFDAAWSDSAGAAGWSRLSRFRDDVPLIAACHAGLTMIGQGASHDFFATTHHAMLRRAAAVIAVSRTVADSIAAGLPEIEGRIRVIPNGADPARFDSGPDEALRRSLGLDARPVLLYLGRVVPEKGCDDLIRAVGSLPEPRPQVLIVGPGPHAADLKTLARSLAVPAIFAGGVEHDQVPAYLALADIFVLPSRHQEGMPFSLVEAMLARRPILATAIGGVPDMIEDGKSGVLTPSGDPAALARAIHRMVSDAPLRARLVTHAHTAALSRYSLRAMIDATERLLRDVTARSLIA